MDRDLQRSKCRERMKNVSRIKFLHCFRRPVVEEVMLEPRRGRNQLMHLLMDEDGNEKASTKSLYGRSRKHSFSRMLKSALFDTALVCFPTLFVFLVCAINVMSNDEYILCCGRNYYYRENVTLGLKTT